MFGAAEDSFQQFFYSGANMIRKILLGGAALLASAAIVMADAKDDVKAAADKINAAPNYSFTSTRANAGGGGGGGGGGRGFGGGATEGKVDKTDGISWLSSPGRGGTTAEYLIKGDVVLIKGDSGWMTPDELAAANGGGGGGGGGGGFNFGAMIAQRMAAMKDPIATGESNLDQLTNFQKTDDGYTADMPEDMVKTQLTALGRGRRGGGGGGGGGAPPAPTITNDKGSYAFTIGSDGSLSKIAIHVTGTIDNGNGNPRDIDSTTTIEIKDVGSTTIDIPDDAKAKLNGAPATQPAQ